MEFWIPGVVVYLQPAAKPHGATQWLVLGKELEG